MLWFRKKKDELKPEEEILEEHQEIDDDISIDEILEEEINIDIEEDVNDEPIELKPEQIIASDDIEEVEKAEEETETETEETVFEDFVAKTAEEVIEKNIPLKKEIEINKNEEEEIVIDEKYLDDFSKNAQHDLICDPCQKPIYILGGGNVGSYLATKLKNYGHKVIVISSPISNKILKTEGINIYEEFANKNTNSVLNTSLKIESEPSMLIIATKANKLKLAITAINPKKLNKCPIVDFTIGDNEQYLRNYFGYSNISKAFLEANISKNKYGKTQILRSEPKIFISPANGFAHKEIYNILSSTGLNVKTITDKISAFWNLFTPYFVGSIITTLYNQNINDVLENQKRKKIIYACINEIESLAKSEKAQINKQQIINKLHNISDDYTFPLHRDINTGKIGESGIFQELINSKTEINKVKCKVIKSIFRQIYGYVLI